MSILESNPIVVEKPGLQKAALPIPAIIAGILLVAGFLGLALYNLNLYPAPWFDEGEHLRVPKTLVENGQYAVWSADGFRYFGPTIGVGPTVLLPVAFSFQFFGVGLAQGRIIIVMYLAAATLLYWFYGNKLFKSGWLATLSVLLLLAAPGLEFIKTGRQGLGEVPALAFFLAGLLFWNVAVSKEKPGLGYPALAGLAWALAAITKSNYGLLLPPAIVLLYLVNRFYYRRVGLNWKVFALPLLMTVGGLGGWYVLVLLFLGGGDFSSNLNLLRTASGGSAFVFAPGRMASALKFLVGPDAMFGLAVPGLLYGLWLIRKRSAESMRLALPLTFCVVWLGWFCFASVGWPRYSFPALALLPLFSAKLLFDLPELMSNIFKIAVVRQVVTATLVLLVVAYSLGGLIPQVNNTLKPDDSGQKLAAYLNQNIPETALVETWESEMGFLTNHRYHYPPADLLDKAVRLKWLNKGGEPLAKIYQPELLKPDYLIEGTFGRWNELYPAQMLTNNYKQVAKFGEYILYERVK